MAGGNPGSHDDLASGKRAPQACPFTAVDIPLRGLVSIDQGGKEVDAESRGAQIDREVPRTRCGVHLMLSLQLPPR